MIRIKDLHAKWIKDPDYRREYEAVKDEFAIAAAMIKARARAGLTQAELARRMQTSQSAIARMEGGRALPSGRTLEKFAKATGSRLRIAFEPVRPSTRGEHLRKNLAAT